MLGTMPVKKIVATWEVYMCAYTVFEEVQKVIQMNVTLYIADCKMFVLMLLAICVLKIQF